VFENVNHTIAGVHNDQPSLRIERQSMRPSEAEVEFGSRAVGPRRILSNAPNALVVGEAHVQVVIAIERDAGCLPDLRVIDEIRRCGRAGQINDDLIRARRAPLTNIDRAVASYGYAFGGVGLCQRANRVALTESVDGDRVVGGVDHVQVSLGVDGHALGSVDAGADLTDWRLMLTLLVVDKNDAVKIVARINHVCR
jgi:hypothetical protein